jgi:hypothetical protein
MAHLSGLVKNSHNSSVFVAKSVLKLSAPIINAGASEKISQNDPWDTPGGVEAELMTLRSDDLAEPVTREAEVEYEAHRRQA